MAGGGSPIARVMGQIDAAKDGSQTQGAEYTPIEGRTYTPQLSSNQSLNPYSQPSALNQQMMQRAMLPQNPYMMGLQNLYSMFSAPRAFNPMPQYNVPALNYRPNMQGAQEVLRRVAPSVAEQRRIQAIEDARRAAEEEANRPAYTGYEGSNY